MKTVYIASPYTLGDVAVNVKKQMDTASALIDMGVAPYWPVHSHFLHMVYPKSYEKWMEQCFHWLEKSDCVLRLPGESKGADREVQRAKELCIPVFYTLNEVFEYFVYLDYKEEQKKKLIRSRLAFLMETHEVRKLIFEQATEIAPDRYEWAGWTLNGNGIRVLSAFLLKEYGEMCIPLTREDLPAAREFFAISGDVVILKENG